MAVYTVADTDLVKSELGLIVFTMKDRNNGFSVLGIILCFRSK